MDERELKELQSEFIELSVAELTDDVDCSLSTLKARDKRLAEIEGQVQKPVAEAWWSIAQLRARIAGYASGRPFDG